MLPIGRVIVFENAVQVADCRLVDLRYEPGPDEFTDVFLPPDAIAAFEEMFFPSTCRRLN
jgi:hypothetical protein